MNVSTSKMLAKPLGRLVLMLMTAAVISSCDNSSTPPPPLVDVWTWISGSNVVNQSGIYGTPGIPDAANVPGARTHSISWIDSGGNLWLFGGGGYDSAGTYGQLNELWRYEP